MLALEDAADLALLLAEDHLVAPPGRSIGGVEAAGAAAGNQDLLFNWGGIDHVSLQLSADQRVDGTAPRGRGGTFCHAGEAPEAPDDVLILAWAR